MARAAAPLPLLLLLLAQWPALGQPAVDPSTLAHKLMVGYQGWHATASDGAGIQWTHWSNNGGDVPGPATVHVDAFPALDEYDPAVLAPVNFSYANGTAARLFSSQFLATTMLHFKWMADFHIHGAFVQRFVQGLDSGAVFAARTRVAQHARLAAEAHGRVFALEYDVSGVADADLLPALQRDWPQVRNLTASPAYLHHGGAPAVIVWGLGFADDGHPATPATAAAIQAYFAAQNVTLIGGVPTYWRTLKNDARADPAWAQVYLRFAVLHPWLVGRFPDDAGADAELAGNILPDLQLCQQHGVGYMPVVWPGFSWSNMHGGATPLNAIPRRSGTFLHHQLDNVLRRAAGATAVFGAMFDEYDEGTAMAKIAATPAQLPAQGRFVYASMDAAPGEAVRGDWWLFLLGLAADALAGAAPWPGPQRPALPTPLAERQVALGVAGLLGRSAGDFETVAGASALAGGGESVAGWCAGIVAGAEFRGRALAPQALALQLYQGCLRAAPDAAGLAATLRDIAAGRTAARAAQLIASASPASSRAQRQRRGRNRLAAQWREPQAVQPTRS